MREQIVALEARLENAARLSKLDMATIEELRGVIGKGLVKINLAIY